MVNVEDVLHRGSRSGIIGCLASEPPRGLSEAPPQKALASCGRTHSGTGNECLLSRHDADLPDQFLRLSPMASFNECKCCATDDWGRKTIGQSMINKATGRLQSF